MPSPLPSPKTRAPHAHMCAQEMANGEPSPEALGSSDLAPGGPSGNQPNPGVSLWPEDLEGGNWSDSLMGRGQTSQRPVTKGPEVRARIRTQGSSLSIRGRRPDERRARAGGRHSANTY